MSAVIALAAGIRVAGAARPPHARLGGFVTRTLARPVADPPVDPRRVVTRPASAGPCLSRAADAAARIRVRLAAVSRRARHAVSLAEHTAPLDATGRRIAPALTPTATVRRLAIAARGARVGRSPAIRPSPPRSPVRVALAPLLTATMRHIMSTIGVSMRVGPLTPHALPLDGDAHERRHACAERDATSVEAGAARPRPIVTTTVAMIAGMLPVVLAPGEGGGLRAPRARPVIAGALTPSPLTLLVVPVAYTHFDDAGRWLGRLRARLRARLRPRLVRAVAPEGSHGG